MFRIALLVITLIIGVSVTFIDWRIYTKPKTDIAFVDGQQYRPASVLNALVVEQTVKEGELVTLGQELFVLDTKKHENVTLSLTASLLTLTNELNNTEIDLPGLRARAERVEKSVNDTSSMIEYTQSRLSQFRTLGENASQTVVDNTTFALNTQQQQLATHQKLEIDLLNQIASLTQRQRDIKDEIALLNRQIDLHKKIKNDHVIVSPISGVVNKIMVKKGEVATAGNAMIDIIDNQNLYITAYFIESYLSQIQIGDEADILFDAYPDPVVGTVLQIEPIAGAKVSGVSPNYSSGSYTRLTQKIPVRIAFETPSETHIALGMSAKVSIK
ncbi:HlyD family secretion protein [Glaciecola petra]|uniref:Efflux RND transporter periplasmic adaptor subunit n=1 Tax=Glaciecola petra TaxID=3075602 RepID=A0ABU2ZR79_9ALTE|nr:HlyD family efflux transporter periplasmic adaptor subunit [Aestuariibacter sp. P117]MDT0595122.1 efflux RND transporter periplasmic adaptor subunit [Aestuariibacter sp. P117]